MPNELLTGNYQFLRIPQAGTFSAGDGDDLPSEILVCPWGEHETAKGKVICNSVTLEQLPKNQGTKFDRVALDFEHGTVPSSPNYKEPQKVAAFGNVEVREGEGVFLSALEWTEEGKAHAKDGHYPDISPAVIRNDQDEVVFLHSAAVCRHGEMDGLTLFSADLREVLQLEADWKPMVAGLLKAMGKEVDPKATDEDLAALAAKAMTPASKEKSEEKESEEKVEKKEDPKEEGKDEIAALKAEVGEMRKALTEFTAGQKASTEKTERERLIEAANQAGKVLPFTAEQAEGIPVDTLSAMISKIEPTVPLTTNRPNGTEELDIDEFGADAPDKEKILTALGHSEEDLKKYGGQ